jgi:DNA invertase Pin-like site-specific DNA recombinase
VNATLDAGDFKGIAETFQIKEGGVLTMPHKRATKPDPGPPRTVSYLRVSTDGEDTEKDKADILKFANDRQLGHVEFVEDQGISGKTSWKQRKIGPLIDSLREGDRLIVPEMSGLGRSVLECMEILSVSKQKEISIYDLRNGWELNGAIPSRVLAMVFRIASEIERDLISKRTKEGLRAARAKGKLLGRPKGPGKSKLDPHREEIIGLLKLGVPKTRIAAKYGCTPVNFWNWLQKNEIDVKPQ